MRKLLLTPVYSLYVLMLFAASSVKAQVAVTPSQTAAALAQELVGNGVVVMNPTLNCATNANGIFVVTTSNLGIDSGIILTSGQAATVGSTAGANGPQATTFPSTSNNMPGDAQLTQLAGLTTNDACILEFDFQPAGDTIKFDYAFGSEEYDNFSCSGFNDVFGFFISGPGITGSQNIALVPSTNIPVAINSTTNPAVTMPGSIAQCQAMGPGSPFAQYYVDNSAGTTISYYGFTTIFTAVQAVIPCSTYHLKLAIADGGDFILDSGVFLKAGSLTSNAISIQPVGGGGLSMPTPYCVRGCLPGQFVFSRPQPKATPLTIKYLIQGTATNGVDYQLIPDSVVIPPNGTTATLNINGIPITPAQGPETVKLMVLSPYNCSSTNPVIIDSAELIIRDSFYVEIIKPTTDTAICKYESVDLEAIGDPALTYTWFPATGLSTTSGLTTTATPVVTTNYTIAASLPGSGCPPSHDNRMITISEEPNVDLGPDITTCLGNAVQLSPTITPVNQNYTYTWTPATGLSSTTIPNPVATPNADQTYVLTVNPGAIGCNGYDTILVHILPNDFNLFTGDTSICKGESVGILALGDTNFSYQWTPATWVSDPTVIDPVITPDTTTTYTITASFPGCTDIKKTITIEVQPNPVVDAGIDRAMCQWDTLHFAADVSPTWYTNYSYSWAPATDLDVPNQQEVVFSGDFNTTLVVTVTTPAGCVGTDDVEAVVYPGNFATVTPSDEVALCARDTFQFTATGGVFYDWSPGYGLSDSFSATPIAYPMTSTLYNLLVTDQYGCHDTFDVQVSVYPRGVVSLPDSIILHPGESVTLDPQGNTLHHEWTPSSGLSATNISNPVASPTENTRYYLTARTEWGCEVSDYVDIILRGTVLDVPNAFSPGSGPNNELKIVKRGIATLKYFRIFNRWGAKVFETTDINKGWDGTLNGEPQPMGVYIYTVDAVTVEGKPFKKQGNVTLIR